MLVIEGLVKKYGKFMAVNGLNLEIPQGQIFGFVGPNGAGKTTTMKIIAGLLQQTSGKVLIDGEDITKNRKRLKNKIGYMPDFFGVYDDLKVSEYMDFYANAHGVGYGEKNGIIDDLLELVDLSGKKDAYVDSLSRGMKQRLCLARSLVHDPSLLILDEPASGLDPRARVEMKEILKELKNMGKTILISSHILPELAEMCTSIGIIEHGKMVIQGTVDDITRKVSRKKQMRVKTLSCIENTVRILEEQPAISSIMQKVDSIDFDYDGDEADLALILKNLISAGIPVVGFNELEGNLEDIFMQVTAGGIINENQRSA